MIFSNQHRAAGWLSAAVITSLLVLAACAARVTRVDLSKLPAEDQAAIRSVRVLNSTQLATMKFNLLGVVEGVSCRNKVWDRPASRSAAVEQAKYYAWELGADGITNLEYGAVEGTSYGTNCWESIRVSAEAIRIEK